MRRGLVALVACAAAALLPAACGGDDRPSAERARADRYVAQVNAAQSQFARRFQALARDVGATITPAQGRRTLRAFEDAVDGTVARLRAVRPPSRVGDLHGRLVTEIAGYGDELASARRAFSSEDPRDVLRAQGRLTTGVQRTSARIDRTIDAINARLGSPSG
jgi:hypothetical protein